MKPAPLFSIFLASFTLLQAAPVFELNDPGTEEVVDYEKYGEFQNVGTYQFKYVIKDRVGLAKASGEGVDPNNSASRDSRVLKLRLANRLKDDQWAHVNSGDPEADFFAWAASNSVDPATRLFFVGKALEKGGLYTQAMKAWRAAMILYPTAYAWEAHKMFTWLVAPAAWGSIVNIPRNHPDAGWKLVDALVVGHQNLKGDLTRNEVNVVPGHFVRYTKEDRDKSIVPLDRLKVVQRRGGKVACVKYDNGQWGLEVEGKPFFVEGMGYFPTKVGCSPPWNWMQADENNNGTNDVAYETWVDKNGNGIQDPDEPRVGDFQLMKEMGTNAIRIMVERLDGFNLPLLRDMQKTYGIYGILNDPFGAYTIHSGASWKEGTDYSDPEQRKNMLDVVRKMVELCKDEPWLLMYMLGNENNMAGGYTGVNATRTNAGSHPEDYATLLNEAAALIHKLDPNHPVGVGNMGTGMIDTYAKLAPELDFVGINEYSGAEGLGGIWEASRQLFDRPVLIGEFGCDAYWTGKGPDEDAQAMYHQGNWEDILYNRAGNPGSGVSIGGIVFEWLDEWWKETSKPGQESIHNTEASFSAAYPDGASNEEWFGIMGQGKGKNSPFLREARKTYFMYKKLHEAEATTAK